MFLFTTIMLGDNVKEAANMIHVDKISSSRWISPTKYAVPVRGFKNNIPFCDKVKFYQLTPRIATT